MSTCLPYNDKNLLLQIADGDEAAFRQLFDQHRQKIYSLGMHITHSEFLAEEIVQDVFIKVWEQRRQLSKINYINSWLRVITRNVCCDYLRNLAIEKLALHNLVDKKMPSPVSPEVNCINREYESVLEDAINELTPQQQKVYLLSRKYGMKQSEIAQQLGISVFTVKEYMKLALRSIHHYLKYRIGITELTSLLLFMLLELFF